MRITNNTFNFYSRNDKHIKLTKRILDEIPKTLISLHQTFN